MGIWDWINSTTDAVKRHAPDPTPVKEACKNSYDYCSATVSNIDTAVRVNGIQKLNDYIPDEETRSQIGLFASKFGQNAARYALREGYKFFPGGKIVVEIVNETLHDVKSGNRSKQDMDAMKEMIGSGGKNSASKNLLDRAETQIKVAELGYDEKGSFADSTTANQTPEDVLRIFMMKESLGTHFGNDLLLPQIKHGNKSK